MAMPNEMIQWFIGQAGISGLAAFALWIVREQSRARDKDREILIQTLQSNTQAMTLLTSVVEKYGDAVDNCELAQNARRNDNDVPSGRTR